MLPFMAPRSRFMLSRCCHGAAERDGQLFREDRELSAEAGARVVRATRKRPPTHTTVDDSGRLVDIDDSVRIGTRRIRNLIEYPRSMTVERLRSADPCKLDRAANVRPHSSASRQPSGPPACRGWIWDRSQRRWPQQSWGEGLASPPINCVRIFSSSKMDRLRT